MAGWPPASGWTTPRSSRGPTSTWPPRSSRSGRSATTSRRQGVVALRHVVADVRPRRAGGVPGAGRRRSAGRRTSSPADVRAAFEESIRRRRVVSRAELGETATEVGVAAGAVVTQRMIPVDRVGLYVPGGLAPLASSVIMNVVPAQVAGVGSIAVSSPPQPEFDGLPHPSILGCCAPARRRGGVRRRRRPGDRHVRLRGRTDLCATGEPGHRPGNIYVSRRQAAAQGQGQHRLRGRPDRDRHPGRLLGADPVYVAADLISQAEHDPSAAAVLVTDSHRARRRGPGRAGAPRCPQAKHAERIDDGAGRPAVRRRPGR